MASATEPEITHQVPLCDARGRLHPAARGWARRPMLRANLRGRRGRKKRWDYWCVISPEVVMSLVYADVDYAGLASCWVLDRNELDTVDAGVLVPFGHGFEMPEWVGTGTSTITRPGFELTIDEHPDHTRLRVGADGRHGPIDIDVTVAKPDAHDSLNVVIPWSDRHFQFTTKDNTRPATGTVRVGARSWEIGTPAPAYAVQDLGRGVWRYANRWNWASGSGTAVDGRLVGLQFGGKWTERTGFTENALCIDGHLTKIHEELEWSYDWDDPMQPWRVRSRETDMVDVTLTPYFDRYDDTDLKILKMEVHQCFGTWAGRVRGDDGVEAVVDGIDGFAEEARNRW